VRSSNVSKYLCLTEIAFHCTKTKAWWTICCYSVGSKSVCAYGPVHAHRPSSLERDGPNGILFVHYNGRPGKALGGGDGGPDVRDLGPGRGRGAAWRTWELSLDRVQ